MTTGIDIVEVDRMRRSLDRSGEAFTHRIFTAGECERAEESRDPLRHYTALFASKEACFKAIGLAFDAGFDWKLLDVDPGHRRLAAQVRCSGAVADHLGGDRVLLSLASGRRYVIALAMRIPPGSHRRIPC